MRNQEKVSFEDLTLAIPMGRIDGNVFRGIGFDKPLLKRFADYFIQKVEGDELKLAFDLFKASNENEQPMFY